MSGSRYELNLFFFLKMSLSLRLWLFVTIATVLCSNFLNKQYPPPSDTFACGQEPGNSLEGFISLLPGGCVWMLPRSCVPQKSGDEGEEDRLHGSCPSTCPLPRRSCQRVQAHPLWRGVRGFQLLDLVMLESKYVGIYFLVFVKTDVILSPAKTLKLPFGAGRWLSG